MINDTRIFATNRCTQQFYNSFLFFSFESWYNEYKVEEEEEERRRPLLVYECEATQVSLVAAAAVTDEG